MHPQRTCSIHDCGVVVRLKATRCERHQNYWRLTGHDAPVANMLAPEYRFMNKIDRSGAETFAGEPCWVWMGTMWGANYGSFSMKRKRILAHRWAYAHFVGPIPEGFQIDHLCRVTRCVNPAHLEAVTPRENTLRSESPSAKRARQTLCTRGHPFDATQPKGRRCNECTNITARARSAARRQQSQSQAL